jgi:cell shape-determining protein MreC
MSKIEQIVNSLEDKVNRVLQDLQDLKQTNIALNEELQELKLLYSEQTQRLETTEAAYNDSKFANTLLGSNESKSETKLKINSLIREIDDCISKLSD